MTFLSKILLVLVFFASIAFMGFAAVSAVGGPNWSKEKDALTDYVFEHQAGENPIWSVKTRRGGEQLTTSPVLAKVIVAAQKHKLQQQNEKLDEVTKTIEPLKTSIKRWELINKVDRTAMKDKATELKQKIVQLDQQIIQLGQQTLEVNQEASERRADIFRLRDQIDEIRNERFLAEQQQKTLRDYIDRIQGKVQRLQRQKESLEKVVLAPGNNIEEKKELSQK